jgi:catechol 2,3-dioxygenase-like lactoylglutathione lyase family enzyme
LGLGSGEVRRQPTSVATNGQTPEKKMESLSLTGIDHYAISVRDVEVSARWYKDIFEFNIINRWSNAWLVGRGNIKVGLFVFPDAAALSDQDSKLIIRKIAFSIDGNLFAGAVELIKARGIRITGPEDTGIAYRFQFNDPDGHLLEVTSFHGQKDETPPNF